MPGPARRRSFTLAELLVVMGIIAVLAAVTVIAVGAIANDARVSSARNTVIAVLENARALAIKENAPVLVAFRARPDGTGVTEQRVEAIMAKWSGDTFLDFTGNQRLVVDRFVPLNEPARPLPRGIKIAAPLYRAIGTDGAWVTSSELPAIGAGEVGGAVVAVMYGPDGTVLAQNPASDSTRIFVDFDNDRQQRYADENYNYYDSGSFPKHDDEYCDFGSDEDGNVIGDYFCQCFHEDEPYVTIAPFLAVFDDEAARERYDASRWTQGGAQERIDDLSEFINEYADRIHFNRYTGVAMR